MIPSIRLAALGLLAAGSCLGAVHYVATNSPASASPFTNWITAAHTIQEAINASEGGDEIIVTNGTYATGGVPADGFGISNRIAVTNAVWVRSVNGPALTIIQGKFDPFSGGAGTNAVRCAYVGPGATLSGFTLTGGAPGVTNHVFEECGGGLFLNNAYASNCIIRGNSASYGGAGVLMQSGAILTHSWIRENEAVGFAGGVMFNGGGEVRNCFIVNNTASVGAGAYMSYGRLESCTVAGNLAHERAGGVYAFDTSFTARVRNTIVYGNTAATNSEYYTYTNLFEYSATTPLPAGPGNLSADPQFVSADYHIRGSSPCINAGTNEDWMADDYDIDGEPRIRRTTVDIGADEFYQFMCIRLTNSAAGFFSTWETGHPGNFQLQSTPNPTGAWSNVGGELAVTGTLANASDTGAPAAARQYKLIYVSP